MHSAPLRAHSSGPPGHLLPVGEKRERVAAVATYSRRASTTADNAMGPRRQRDLFSPTGRRWRVAPDEGVPKAMQTPPADPTKRRPGKTGQARTLRANDTEAEYRLWSELRNRHLNGYKFSRQIPLGPYIVDFICREHHLVIELDGSQHADSSHDIERTVWLNQQGYSVLRFWNGEVLTERRGVLETVLAVLNGQIAEPCGTLRFSPATRGSR